MEIHDRRTHIIREWGKHRSIQQYLADRCPNEWDAIRECKTGHYAIQEDGDEPGDYRVYPKHSCHKIPWCIMCVRDEEARRRGATRDLISLCTPANEEPRMAHMVLEAMVRNDDSTGWGVQASRDLPRFFQATHELLTELFGEGIGWKGSYQDFGERPFKKVNPHLDFTLNGYRIQEGQSIKLKPLNVKGNSGADWLMRKQAEVLKRHFQDVVVTMPLHLGWFVPPHRYEKALRYQLREMVNLTRFRYNRARQTMTWHPYNEEPVTVLSVLEFEVGVAEYQARLGQWGYEPAQELHRGMGHMAKRSVRTTAKAIGGCLREHPKNCSCRDCGDWQRVFLDEAATEAGAARPLPYRG